MAAKPTRHHIGERLSLKSQVCTVRYIGLVDDKPGAWVGVEWDDANRGKHNGSHDGVVYFTCRSQSATCASFLRSDQPWDPPRTFLQALREKYIDPQTHGPGDEIVYISGKQAEEVGFEKFSRRQARLQGIRVLVLDRMQIRHHLLPEEIEDGNEIEDVCSNMTEMDLSGNLFETLGEVIDLCRLLPKLRVLTLDGNRFSVDLERDYASNMTVRSLGLSLTLLDQAEVSKVASFFPALESMNLGDNEYSDTARLQALPLSLQTLDLSHNELTSLSDCRNLEANCPHLHTLILKHNRISSIITNPEVSLGITELDLSHNEISAISFFDSITMTGFPNIKHLRTTGNPVYRFLVSAEGKPLSAEDGYMLTIARLPQLEELNYRRITEKEKLNAETYYLNQIGVELSNVPETQEEDVRGRHPRYRELYEEYGQPRIVRSRPARDEFDANSLAARLVTMTFILSPDTLPDVTSRSWTEELPKAFAIYSVLGMVGKRLDIHPLSLRLVLETDERDPVGRDSGYAGPEWWDSSDDEEVEIQDEDGEIGEWVSREVEMIASTRTVGTFMEGREARVRIEIQHNKR